MAGSVIKKPNNKWELRVSLGYDENNKQRRKTKTVYAKTKKEAEKMLAEFFLELKDTLVIDHDITFKEFYSSDCSPIKSFKILMIYKMIFLKTPKVSLFLTQSSQTSFSLCSSCTSSDSKSG